MLPAILLGMTGQLRAQSASFNFSLNAHSVSGWVNVAGDPSTAVRTGTSGSISVSSIGTDHWSQYSGSLSAAFDGGGMTGTSFFPTAVMANMWFQYSTFYGAYNAALYLKHVFV